MAWAKPLSLVVALSACSSSAGSEPTTAATELSGEDFEDDWVRLPLPGGDEIGQMEALVETGDGYAALYRSSLGAGKAASEWENRVFVTSDGVEWSEHRVPLDEASFYFRDMAYGNGRLVLVGARFQAGLVATSRDGATWSQEAAPDVDLRAVGFVGDGFYALSNGTSIWRSTDGTSWAGTETETVQLSDIAFGNGVYVAVGSGPIEVSLDGASWSAVYLDCTAAGNCVTDPSGGVHQRYTSDVFFAAGRFHAQGLTSTDGTSWERDEGPAPGGYYGGYLLSIDGDVVDAWKREESVRLRVALRPWVDGDATCATKRCFVLGETLIMVP